VTVFVVRHQHPADRCPAADFTAGAGLLNHLSRANAARHGVRIRGEAVLQAHTLVMIAEADDEDELRAFLRPFEAAGTVEVEAGSSCARIVAGGGCATALSLTDPDVPSLDPEVACQDALDAGLVVHRAHPLNCETPLPALTGGVVMPNARFYVRNHFQIPDLDPATWRLQVGGLVERPLTLSLAQLRAMPSATTVVTLECAGNGRSSLEPPVSGEQWGVGAVSTAEWTGVPLTEVMERAGVRGTAREIVFRGADRGEVEGRDGSVHFERSLLVDHLRSAGALLAYAMNGDELPVHHGYPLRLVVPGWYAVASVKWLTEIELIDRLFDGHFQVDRYHIDGEPVTLQRVRSLIIEPRPGDAVEAGEIVIRGVAWSGAAPIARVEVRIDEQPWQLATLVGERRPHSWQWWELPVRCETSGAITVQARATDLAGRTQPDQPQWNPLGYSNNVVHQRRVTVAPSTSGGRRDDGSRVAP
jgi:DMSO/TMAO reductase YedYZ molybdopterin-dependent catalytic subunit